MEVETEALLSSKHLVFINKLVHQKASFSNVIFSFVSILLLPAKCKTAQAILVIFSKTSIAVDWFITGI